MVCQGGSVTHANDVGQGVWDESVQSSLVAQHGFPNFFGFRNDCHDCRQGSQYLAAFAGKGPRG